MSQTLLFFMFFVVVAVVLDRWKSHTSAGAIHSNLLSGLTQECWDLRNLQVSWCYWLMFMSCPFPVQGEVNLLFSVRVSRLAWPPQLIATMGSFFSSDILKHMRTISICFIFWNCCKYFTFFGCTVLVHFLRGSIYYTAKWRRLLVKQ